MNEIEVKALEWTALREGDEVAESILGTYTITGGSVFFVWFAGQADYEDYALEAPSMEAAKAAAKADYEQRILSALTTSPTPPAADIMKEARAAVESIFEDLRDRRFLKWLFDRHGDENLIGRFDDGEELRGLDIEVQEEIKAAWSAIIQKYLVAMLAMERERCAQIIEARLPLYTELGQRNALKECISSIRSAGE